MPTRDIVHEWFRTRLASGPLARDTEAYNQVIGALPALIEQLEGSTPANEAPPGDPPAPDGSDHDEHA